MHLETEGFRRLDLSMAKVHKVLHVDEKVTELAGPSWVCRYDGRNRQTGANVTLPKHTRLATPKMMQLSAFSRITLSNCFISAHPSGVLIAAFLSQRSGRGICPNQQNPGKIYHQKSLSKSQDIIIPLRFVFDEWASERVISFLSVVGEVSPAT